MDDLYAATARNQGMEKRRATSRKELALEENGSESLEEGMTDPDRRSEDS
jgi:hypothetical protein